MKKKELGNLGEKLAAEYLEKKNKGIIHDDLCDEDNFNNLLYILENKVGDNHGKEEA